MRGARGRHHCSTRNEELTGDCCLCFLSCLSHLMNSISYRSFMLPAVLLIVQREVSKEMHVLR
jgi:hypothetical protein